MGRGADVADIILSRDSNQPKVPNYDRQVRAFTQRPTNDAPRMLFCANLSAYCPSFVALRCHCPTIQNAERMVASRMATGK